jgi:hypothetical protein
MESQFPNLKFVESTPRRDLPKTPIGAFRKSATSCLTGYGGLDRTAGFLGRGLKRHATRRPVLNLIALGPVFEIQIVANVDSK